jgi:hypothetical protein
MITAGQASSLDSDEVTNGCDHRRMQMATDSAGRGALPKDRDVAHAYGQLLAAELPFPWSVRQV